MQLTEVNQRYLNKMFFSVLEREQTIMQRPGHLLFLNSLERCGARGCGLRGHSWARMGLPILLAQCLRREFDGCGWSGAVLLASWESGNLSPGGPVGKLGACTRPVRSAEKHGAGEKGRVPEGRARRAHVQRPGLGARSCL